MDNGHTNSGQLRRLSLALRVRFEPASPGATAPRSGPCRAPNRDGASPRTHGEPYGVRFGAPATPATRIAPPRAKMSRPPDRPQTAQKAARNGLSRLTAPPALGRSAPRCPHGPARGRNCPWRPSTAVGGGRHEAGTPGPWLLWPYTSGAAGLAVQMQIHRDFTCIPPPYEGRGAAKSLIGGPSRPVSGSVRV
jgi:hypothetical protein